MRAQRGSLLDPHVHRDGAIDLGGEFDEEGPAGGADGLLDESAFEGDQGFAEG